MTDQAVGLAVLDIIDKPVDIFGEQFGIADQRRCAGIIALGDGASRLALKLACLIRQPTDKRARLAPTVVRQIRSHPAGVTRTARPVPVTILQLNPCA